MTGSATGTTPPAPPIPAPTPTRAGCGLDLLDTLAVEAGLHHLDLVTGLDRPGPNPTTLAAVRATLDRRLGRTTPTRWDDAAWARVATGRADLGPEVSTWLGEDADRLPLIH